MVIFSPKKDAYHSLNKNTVMSYQKNNNALVIFMMTSGKSKISPIKLPSTMNN